MNLGSQVICARDRKVAIGVLIAKSTRLSTGGKENDCYTVLTRNEQGEQQEKEYQDDEIIEITPWNDAAQNNFFRKALDGEWAKNKAQELTEPAPTPPPEPPKAEDF